MHPRQRVGERAQRRKGHAETPMGHRKGSAGRLAAAGAAAVGEQRPGPGEVRRLARPGPP